MKQSLSEIKKLSADMLARERQVANAVNETTPASLTPALEKFCMKLSGEAPVFVPVVDDPNGLFGWCSDGVAEKIKADGGSVAFGWTIWEWPDVLWTAEFHAVWRSLNGDLIDITPKPKRESRILFVPDSQYPETFDFDNRPGSQRQSAYQPADTAQLARERIATLKPSQIAYEQKRAAKAGISLLQWFENKMPKDVLPSLIEDVIKACDEQESYFDTLGVSGEIRADSKLTRLIRSRVTSLEALKRALNRKR
jgi:hypothetical protein